MTRRRGPCAAGVAAVLAGLMCTGVLLPGCRRTRAASCGPVEGIVEPTTGHVLPPATVMYEHHPPTSGRHVHDAPAPGVHRGPIPEVNQVAALERGFVLLQYGPGVGAARLNALREKAGPLVIVAPAVRIDGGRTVAFTAWQHRQLCDGVVSAAADRFIARFAGHPAL